MKTNTVKNKKRNIHSRPAGDIRENAMAAIRNAIVLAAQEKPERNNSSYHNNHLNICVNIGSQKKGIIRSILDLLW